MHMPEMAPAGHVIEEVGTAATVDCSDMLVALMPLCCKFTWANGTRVSRL